MAATGMRSATNHFGALALAIPREFVLCPACPQVLGETIGPLFVSQHKRRIYAGPLPAFILCDSCGGLWRNPAWGDVAIESAVQWLRLNVPEAEREPFKG